jgi:ribonuclease HI
VKSREITGSTYGATTPILPGLAVAAACDGACKRSGFGGWGYVIELADGRRIEASGAEPNSTNNRQELRAAIAALQALAELQHTGPVELATDSTYVRDGLTRWLPSWKRNDWRTAEGEPVKNRDLWEALEQAAAAAPWVQLVWVRGHNGHPLNEAADQLASAAAEHLRQQQQPTAGLALVGSTSPVEASAWLAELVEGSGIATDVALLNAAPFGPGTNRHWEDEREELIRHKLRKLETEKLAGNGHVQNQAGHLASQQGDKRINLRKTYRHLEQGGWRTLSDSLPGLPAFNQWKPAQSRLSKDNKPIKYETPAGFPDGGGLLLPRVPERVWWLICQQQDLPFPAAAVRAAGFWVWALATPALQLTIVEGFKKALAAISCGIAAVALPGVTMGRRTDGGVSERLIADLQLLAAGGRNWVICFDADRKPETAAMVHGAAKSLANCLLKAACSVSIARLELPNELNKLGLDDVLVSGGTDAVHAALTKAKPYIRETVSIGGRHFKASDIPHPEVAPLVALLGGMGSNKTGAVADKGKLGIRMVSVTHRRALADQQGERLQLPVLREGELLGCTDVARGFVVVLDSSHPGGSCHLKPSECRGKLLFIDEADAVLLHALTARTEIKRHRIEALENLCACIRAAAQVVIASAHLDEATISAYEQMRAQRALVVRSALRPAAGRTVELQNGPSQLLDVLRRHCCARQPVLVHTGSKELKSNWGPTLLTACVQQWWPEASVLVMDRDTIRDPAHPASEAIKNPALLLHYDVVIATPVLETGFSIEDPAEHFKAVIGYSSGHLPTTAVVQSLGRLRSAAPRFIYVRSTGQKLANGATDAAAVREDRDKHAKDVLDLFMAGQMVPALGADAFYRWWADLIALRNREAGFYEDRIRQLLQREGYAIRKDHALSDKELIQLRNQLHDDVIAKDAALIAALPATDPTELAALEERQALTADERDRRDRGRITSQTGIQDPTAEQVATWRRHTPQASLLRDLLLRNPAARRLLHQRLLAKACPSAIAFRPDLTDHFRDLTLTLYLSEQMKERRALRSILHATAGTELSAELIEAAQQHAQADRRQWRERIGFDPGDATRGNVSPLQFARSLLKVVGLQLQVSQQRAGSRGNRSRTYVVIDPLAPLNRAAVEAHVLAQLQSPRTLANTGIGVQKSPIEERTKTDTPPRPKPANQIQQLNLPTTARSVAR